MAYLPNLTVLGIELSAPLPEGLVQLPVGAMRFFAVRNGFGRRRFYLAVPRLIYLLLREGRKATIIHSTVGYGEGVPYGWFAYPIARLLGKRSVCIIEASFWRLFPGERASLKRRFEAWASEHINRWLIRQLDYVAYQHEEYQSSLPSPKADGGVLTQASWISSSDVIDADRFERRWAERVVEGTPPRMIFAARLVEEKGTRILAAAIELLRREALDLDVDIVGEGPEREFLAKLNGVALGSGTVRLREPIVYGPAFFDFLAEASFVVVPSLTDEQPRIVYDAAAQGIGAVVSDTAGLKSCVVEDGSAVIVPRNDPRALANAIRDLVQSPSRMQELGRGARLHAHANTHERMHEERCRELKSMLARHR
jgi:glycosyltransferase involved in cell wall biosynthesis